MTWFDLLLLGVLALSIGFAAIRGAIREIGTLAALGGGALVAWWSFTPLLGVLGLKGSFFGMVGLAAVLMGIFFIAFYAAIHFGLKRVALDDKMIRIDRIGGGVFGLVRGLALIGLGYLGYAYYLDEDRRPEAVTEAFMLPVAESAAGFFESIAPVHDSERIITPDEIKDEAAAGALQYATADTADKANAASEGYKRGERAALAEILTTTTTSAVLPADQNETAGGAKADDDPIAALLSDGVRSGDADPKARDR